MTTVEFISYIMEVEATVQVVHWQTIEWEHLVTDELYKSLQGNKDRFVEAHQGVYGIVRGYKPIAVNDGVDLRKYLKGAMQKIDTYQRTLPMSFLQQIVQDIQESISVALFKLG
jgi:Family of unknown function (DUF5856)